MGLWYAEIMVLVKVLGFCVYFFEEAPLTRNNSLDIIFHLPPYYCIRWQGLHDMPYVSDTLSGENLAVT